ncbi:DNA polymerase III subunits gamma and tau [Pediococcus damnosus]|uniref:DNA-directed DNA polymerase n=1 Tax=Pediococcus damnosus TaxID=51663 RepID=A0A0R2HDL5_9LACO|nr:DNA polymerase III subunit gamma/tau [Pediococcus damnosus]AMV60073.1 DNA polymerase III subunits gamma and tau [Pediococcus damnosus]AMV62613.1 DNA polymerase III subunits gamma and tau [Pediococcus damnosus]AMV64318.1 DNA polymerase III subunits gamma and tau [Pediococcus damnosus]AMV67508.1 DNA polymerase III subunits gamma and tau [Pediococcus damnosus]KJU74747.1 DNA polymerase III subunit gamma/tau [Pediococcus damnosus LMG 28219]
MSYQALYRVWRPQRFDEIVGQQVITQTLKNALITDQTSHAYLFTGPRGTGKTSAAKIFAKAINCRHLKDGEPCNECATCKAITQGRLNDVIEIDAASNNGVEEIRDIRDKAKYAPTEADYKVYIIDEVHMLSTGAFNALLKTLEEPPANVVFILATTEPQKIPLTIISRTQRFDFRRISIKDSYDRMAYILQQKQITFDKKALLTIAKAAEGGMRDALSILDQTLSFGDNEITLKNALQVTGSVGHDLLNTYVKDVSDQKVTSALNTLEKVLAEGKDANRFIEDLINFCRNLLLYQQDPSLIVDQELGDVDEQFKSFAATLNAERIYQMIDHLNDTQQQMRFTTHPDVYMEVLTIKLAEPTKVAKSETNLQTVTAGADQAPVAATEGELGQLKDQVKELTNQVKKLEGQSQTTSKPAGQNKTVRSNTSKRKQGVKPNLTKIYPVLANATKQNLVQLKEIWPDLIAMLDVTQRALMHVAQPVAASESGAVIAFDYAFLYEKAADDGDLRQLLSEDIDKLVGHDLKIAYVDAEQWPEIRKSYIQQHKDDLQSNESESDETNDEETSKSETASQTEQDPVVTQAETLFGSETVEVKDD